MTHGDDQGLILPPRLAPIQFVIVPIFRTDEEKSVVMEAVEKVKSILSEFRIKVDDRVGMTPGFKFNDWELRGVPVRLEIGPKDVANQSVIAARRDIPGRDGKTQIPFKDLHEEAGKLLTAIHNNLLKKATDFRESHTHEPKDYNEFMEVVQNGWALSPWCGDAECEAKIKEETKATTRCIPFNQESFKGKCIACGKSASEKVIFAKAY
jgi:prolyl-tRNA synthetase